MRFIISFMLLSICTSLIFAADPIKTDSSSGGWSYYGIQNGPAIVNQEKGFRYGSPWPMARWGNACTPGVSLYIPPIPTFCPTPNDKPAGVIPQYGSALKPTPPRTLTLGWAGYSTPSPRNRPGMSVSVWP